MTEQPMEIYEKILDKIEDVRKDVRASFLKTLTIMLGVIALFMTGGGITMTAMLNKAEKNQDEIVKLKVEQGVKKERDRFIQNTQATEIVNLIEACGKKKYTCDK